MLGRLHPDKNFELSTDLDEAHRWPVEEHDLNELMGNLLDNAGKWASQHAELALWETDVSFCLQVADDGAGVADIVDRYSGQITFSRSPAGGLNVLVVIPA
jgi:signal transduction histidine kinase